MLHSARIHRARRWADKAPSVGAMLMLPFLTACAGSNWSLPAIDLTSASGETKAAEPRAVTTSVTPGATSTPTASLATTALPPEVAEARALRRAGDKKKALDVIEAAIARTTVPDRALLAEGGLLALDLGAPGRAEAMLRQAVHPTKPDWRIESGLGIAASAQGRHEEARRHFKTALALSPGQPSVLNNLALSHVLEKKTSEAEKVLKEAAKAAPKSARIKQNLALTQGLKGRGDEAGEAESPNAPVRTAPSRKVTEVSPAPSAAPSSPRVSAPATAVAVSAAASLPAEQIAKPAPRERLAQSGGLDEMAAGN